MEEGVLDQVPEVQVEVAQVEVCREEDLLGERGQQELRGGRQKCEPLRGMC